VGSIHFVTTNFNSLKKGKPTGEKPGWS